MENNKFNEAVEDFIDTRINHFGEEETDGLQEAAKSYKKYVEKLFITLNPEQVRLWNDIESAQSLLSGEMMSFYYKAGFADALDFIYKMKGN